MTNKEIKEQLQKENSSLLKESLIQSIIYTVILIILISSFSGIESKNTVLIIIMIIETLALGAWAIFQYYIFFTELTVYLNPAKNPILKRYGSEEEVLSILRKLLKNADYKDEAVIMSQKYICGTASYSSLIAFKDIVNVKKVEGIETHFIRISIQDKYDKYVTYMYTVNDKDLKKKNSLVDNVIKMIRERSKNLDNEDNKEIEDEDYESIDNEEEYFTCDNCGAKVSEDANKCPKCGAIFDDEEDDDDDDFEEDEEDDNDEDFEDKNDDDNEDYDDDDDEEDDDDNDDDEDGDDDEEDDDDDEETESRNKDITVDDKFDALVKLKELLDKDIITQEEFEKEKKKILK